MRLGVWGLGCALALVVAVSARAQQQPAPVEWPDEVPDAQSGAASDAQPQAQPSAPAPAPSSECVPFCRDGYMCLAGQCVSACNPPCPDGHVCRDGRTCEPVAASAPLPAPEAAPDPALAQYKAELAEERASAYRHDGFYLRLGFTIGYAIDRADDDGVVTKSSGAGGFLDWAIGGSPTDGVVIAFAQHTLGVFEPDTEEEGVTLQDDHSALYQVLGLMLDVYLDPADGWHAAITLGAGAADILYVDYNDKFGVGLGLTAGYDLWFAEQWSFGMAAQLFYITGGRDEFGKHEAVVPMLALSALLH
jgi:hypothetical protein